MAQSKQEKFVSTANIVHKGFYNYDRVNYISAKDKVVILCPDHGIFEQTPNNHLSGNGCTACANVKRHTTQKKLLNDFITHADILHNSKFDYSFTTYINSHIKVDIICPIHGKFSMTPSNHLNGQGCPACSLEKSRWTTEKFVKKSKELFGDYFDYSDTVFTHICEDINIDCPKHGKLTMVANNHLNSKYGCFHCSKNRSSKSENRWLDFHNIPEHNRQIRIKIGNKYFTVDGYDKDTNTIYEFYGDFWHGNPERFDPTDINPVIKKPFSELYEKYKIKKTAILDNGYNLIDIWESNWNSKTIQEE